MLTHRSLGQLQGTWRKNNQETDVQVTFALSRPSSSTESFTFSVEAGHDPGPDREIATVLTVEEATKLRDELDAVIADVRGDREPQHNPPQ